MLIIQKSIVYVFILFFLFSPSTYYVAEGVSLKTDENITDGIDVSAWQDIIDWPLVSNDGYHFCFVKATEGVGWTDPFFEANMNEGSSVGVVMGAYHFATPAEDDAVDEAEYFVDIAEEFIKDGFLRPVLDLEQGSSLGIDTLSNWVHTWMQTVEDLTGVEPIIYVNSNYANNYLLPSVTQYPLWIAHWTYNPNGTPDTGIWENWSFWQYSDQGSVEGITGYVDLNVFNGNLNDLSSYVIGNDLVYVDDDAEPSWYDARHVHTIQEGIDNASIGDTVFVYTGTYFENVVVDKTIDLIGEHKTSTIIDGGLNGDVLTVTADNVRIMNFSIQHSGEDMNQDKAVRISKDNCSFNDNVVAHSAGALYLSNSKNCTLKDNMFYNCTHDLIFDQIVNSTLKNNHITNCRGVHLIDSDYNLISYNQIINTSSGFYIRSSSYNNIIGNNLSNNGNEFYAGFGLLLEVSSCYNLIELNHICNNTDEGIWSYTGSNNNTIKNNDIALNMIGVFFDDVTDNKVFYNNFIDNEIYNARDYGQNIWDNGYPSGGNYWDDYTGTDADDDGFGDTAYNIVGGSNQDHYPFMNEDGWIGIDANQSSYNRPFLVRHASDGDWGGAQNFVPSVDTLTRLELLMKKLGTPDFDLTVELREGSIDGTLLDTIIMTPGDFSSDWEWIELDFEDVSVTPDTNYFVVLNPPPTGLTTTFGYGWGYALGNMYDEGSLWFTRTSGSFWLDLPDLYDFTFRTYGY